MNTSEIFYKLGHNAEEATRDINKIFRESTATERTAWFEKSHSGDMKLRNERRRKPEPMKYDEQLIKVYLKV